VAVWLLVLAAMVRALAEPILDDVLRG